jgi:hypothetical protein
MTAHLNYVGYSDICALLLDKSHNRLFIYHVTDRVNMYKKSVIILDIYQHLKMFQLALQRHFMCLNRMTIG